MDKGLQLGQHEQDHFAKRAGGRGRHNDDRVPSAAIALGMGHENTMVAMEPRNIWEQCISWRDWYILRSAKGLNLYIIHDAMAHLLTCIGEYVATWSA